MADKWLARVAVAEFLVIALLSAWLWGSRQPEDVLIATREYHRTRTVYDTVKLEAATSRRTYREAREVLTITDTVEVERALSLADTALARDSVALAAADSALARADDVIRALRKANKPPLIQPYIEVTHNPHTKEYAGRLGVSVNVTKRVSGIAVTEVRKDGIGFAVGIRITF